MFLEFAKHQADEDGPEVDAEELTAIRQKMSALSATKQRPTVQQHGLQPLADGALSQTTQPAHPPMGPGDEDTHSADMVVLTRESNV